MCIFLSKHISWQDPFCLILLSLFFSDSSPDHPDYTQMTGLPLLSETHGGDDVPIYSRGPFAHLLTGVNHQSIIPHVIAYAACLNPPVNGHAKGAHCLQLNSPNSHYHQYTQSEQTHAPAAATTQGFVAPPLTPVVGMASIKTRRKARI